jgi:xylulokinase
MTERLIIGLDSSTQSTKAIAWTKQGDIVALGRADIPMAVLPQARYEQCPDDWWTSACAALRELCSKIDPTLVDAMAISNQRETIGFF